MNDLSLKAIRPGLGMAITAVGAAGAAYARHRTIAAGLARLERDAARSARRLDQMSALVETEKVPLASHVEKLMIDNPALSAGNVLDALSARRTRERLLELRDLITNANRDVGELLAMLPAGALAQITEKMRYTKDRFDFLGHYVRHFDNDVMPRGATPSTPDILAYERPRT